MPAGYNITVKKADGTTDTVFMFDTPFGGDGNPARWYGAQLGATAATRPEFRQSSKAQRGTRRQFKQSLWYPYHVVNTTTGITSVPKSVFLRMETEIDNEIPSTVIGEAVAQFVNICAHALMKSAAASGQACT